MVGIHTIVNENKQGHMGWIWAGYASYEVSGCRLGGWPRLTSPTRNHLLQKSQIVLSLYLKVNLKIFDVLINRLQKLYTRQTEYLCFQTNCFFSFD